jgi:AraC-like DNA-binding protein
MVQSLLLKFIYQITQSGTRQAVGKKSNGNDVIEKVIQYIKQNLTADLSLDSISRLTNFSPIHFHNRFKAATGRTLRDFVKGERIGKAANLLISTELTLTEIAYECGFSSQAYFSYAFKKRIGVTPRQYAKAFYNRYNK